MIVSPAPPRREADELDLHELLAKMLAGPIEERVHLFVEGCRRGWGGMTVLDHACADHGVPRKHTFQSLWAHVKRFDSPTRIDARGHRLHTPENTVWGSAEDTGYGPVTGSGLTR